METFSSKTWQYKKIILDICIMKSFKHNYTHILFFKKYSTNISVW